MFHKLTRRISRLPVPPGPSRDARGFTLVEMMIALVLFGVGLMALAQALPQGLSVRDKARRMTNATNLAQEQVEELRDLDFDAAELAAGNHSDPDNPINGAYSRRWTVQDGVPVTDMKRVTVTVSFKTSTPDSMAIMTTQISRGSR